MKKILIAFVFLILPTLLPTLAHTQSSISGRQGIVSDKNIQAYDCSGTITAGGTAQLLFPVGGATPARSPNIRGFMIMNVDTVSENLCISFTGAVGAATCATTGYYGLQPATASASGGSYASQLGFGPGQNPVIVAATTGHKFTCSYW